MRHAYLHGFASSPRSRKGVALREAFAAAGAELAVPDLNAPSFPKLTVTAALGELDAMDAAGPPGSERWGLVGSSLGGYLAARWAELHPDRVERLVLLAPGFALLDRWPELLGDQAFALWEKKGAFFFPDADEEPTPVHWGLIEDTRRHPRWPVVPCPTLIFHGRDDEVVPIEYSRRYAGEHPQVRLVELDDDHELTASIDSIARQTIAFFGL